MCVVMQYNAVMQCSNKCLNVYSKYYSILIQWYNTCVLLIMCNV